MKKVEHKIEVYPFSFNKLVSNTRKIDIRPYKKMLHNLTIGDEICYTNLETKEEVKKEVKGLALFGDFETAINMLDEKLIGYDSKEEIRIRVKRMYDKKEVKECGVVAFFIEEVKSHNQFKLKDIQRAI